MIDEMNKVPEEYNGHESKIKRSQLFDDTDFSISNQPLNKDEKSQIDTAIAVLSHFSGAPQFEWVQEMIPVIQDRLGLKQNSKEVISIELNVDLKGIEHLGTLYNAIINEWGLIIFIHFPALNR